MGLPPWATSSSQQFILVTGANSGIGFAICERLIDEFLSQPSRDPTSHLILIVSTRSKTKSLDTVTRLRQHLKKFAENSGFAKELKKSAGQQGKSYDWRTHAARVHLLGVEVDLTDLRQVYSAAKKIRGDGGGIGSPDGLQNVQIPRLDVLIMNAGIGGWKGLNWPHAIWDVLTKMPRSVTWPEFKIARVGATVKQQLGLESEGDKGETQQLLDGTGHVKDDSDKEEPVLGEVFCANLFGHYILGHELMSLLSNSDGRAVGEKGRVVWLSSIESQDQVIDEDDFQCLSSDTPYECTKRITDVLAITSDLPSVQKASAPWFDVSSSSAAAAPLQTALAQRPEVYLTHPGICTTGIIELAFVLRMALMCGLFIARLLGSIWHPVLAYKGAVAPVWVALAEQSTLDAVEAPHGAQKAKWGSSTDRWGNERVRRTEVGGWGWRGLVGEETHAEFRRGRKEDLVELTVERREEFEAMGARFWRKMEELRTEWEERLGLGE